MAKRNQELIKKLLKTTLLKRRAFFFISDILLIALSMYASFWFRFEGNIPEKFAAHLEYYILLALTIKLGFLIFYKQYNIYWRFYSLKELVKLSAAIAFSSLVLTLLLFFLKTFEAFLNFPRSVVVLDFILTLGLLGAVRISKRAIQSYGKKTLKGTKELSRILIFGAGSAGEQIVREMLNNKQSEYVPVGYIDDDPDKKGISMHGIRVIGNRTDLPHLLRAQKIDEVLMAIPSVSSNEIRTIVKVIRDSVPHQKIKILPGLSNLLDGKVTLQDIQEVEIDNLLGREPVPINYGAIRNLLSGKRVLITGAGGSIGSELSKKVYHFDPGSLGLLEIDETELYMLFNQMNPKSSQITPILANITDGPKMRSVFETFRPEIVIHAAAYKHVPLLEDCPEEAVKTNITGTKILADLSIEFSVEKFVYISTDKAINPTSVMGFTKRICEEMLRCMNSGEGTRFVSVRFGNVLGSRGSVTQLFKEQIKSGGPVTVTHADMRRYFMAISEAVLLVLEASAFGEGGEAYVLDMGSPVKIVDMAREMIKLSGFEPDVDIPIVFTGVRPGEKLFEELLSAEEGSEPTKHPKIFKVKDSSQRISRELFAQIEHLKNLAAEENRKDDIIASLKKIVLVDRLKHNKRDPVDPQIS